MGGLFASAALATKENPAEAKRWRGFPDPICQREMKGPPKPPGGPVFRDQMMKRREFISL